MLPDELRLNGESKKVRKSSEWARWNNQLSKFARWTECWNKKPSHRQFDRSFHLRFLEFCGEFSGRILDVGCGSGMLGSYLKGVEYIGIDPLPQDVDFVFSFVQAVGEYMPFRNEVFENVIVMSSLDHTLYPLRVLEECSRVLKKNGQILISIPLEKGGAILKGIKFLLQARFKDLIQGIQRYIFAGGMSHLHIFEREDLRKLLAQKFNHIEDKGDLSGEHIFARAKKQLK